MCVRCSPLGASDYLFGAKELKEKNLTGGHTCLPICKDCLKKEVKVVEYGNKIPCKRERRKRGGREERARVERERE